MAKMPSSFEGGNPMEGGSPMHFRNRQSAVFPAGSDSLRMAVLNEKKECQCRRTMLPPQLQRSAPNLPTPHCWFNTSRKAGPGSSALWRSLIGFWIGTCVRTQDLLRGQTDIVTAARREGRTVRTACSGREVVTSIFETDHPALHIGVLKLLYRMAPGFQSVKHCTALSFSCAPSYPRACAELRLSQDPKYPRA